MRIAYSVLIGNSEEKKTFWRPECRWEDSIKTDLKEPDNVD
jgi:hypothetical protein